MRFIFAALLGAMLTFPACAQEKSTDTFSDKERAAIETIVRDYILEHPEILPQAFEELQRRMNAQAVTANRDALYKDPDSPTAGNPKGDVTIVEFLDYTCGYCKASAPGLKKLLATDKNVRVIFKDLPVLGDVAVFAAHAALAANLQGEYMAFHNALYDHPGRLSEDAVMTIAQKVGLDVTQLKQDMNKPEITAAIGRNLKLANELGLRGTPAFIINGHLIPRALSFDMLQGCVTDARNNKTCDIDM